MLWLGVSSVPSQTCSCTTPSPAIELLGFSRPPSPLQFPGCVRMGGIGTLIREAFLVLVLRPLDPRVNQDEDRDLMARERGLGHNSSSVLYE